MKKLIIALSAIAAAVGFTTSAQADISVAGSSNVAYLSTSANTTGGDEELAVGNTVDFSMSTTTSGGIGISASMSLSQDYDSNGQTVTSSVPTGVDGGNAVTFTTGGATIVVGDVEISDTIGSVGGVVNGPLDDASDLSSSVASGFLDDDGLGAELTTAMGAASINISFVSNDDADNFGILNSSVSGANAATSASITMPFGAYSVTVGVADSDSGESSSGASASGTFGGGTATIGYSNQTLIATGNSKLSTGGDSEVIGATYVMSMDADTTISVGYQNKKDADSESSTQTDLSVERSLGGGATVYLDIRNLTGDTASNADGTAIGFGTSVAF
jgi:hypothetical protein